MGLLNSLKKKNSPSKRIPKYYSEYSGKVRALLSRAGDPVGRNGEVKDGKRFFERGVRKTI